MGAVAFPIPFGRYRLTARIGGGGQADVFRAETEPIAGVVRTVAIKRMHGEIDADDGLADEARIWVRLQHPNIVNVVDFGQVGREWFLALELVDGISAGELVEKTGPLPEALALHIGEGVAHALGYAHALKDESGQLLKVIHRDVKPANILLSRNGQVKRFTASDKGRVHTALVAAQIIDGKAIAEALRASIRDRAAKLKASRGIVPGLATVLVGEDAASKVYVGAKHKACGEAGFRSIDNHFPGGLSESDLLALVKKLNADPDVHGILVQLPLPKGIDEKKVLNLIDPAKDVDGFHPMNVGRMMIGEPGPLPCTPAGCMVLLEKSGVPLAGARAVVVGRSNIVGKPAAILLLRRDATVTTAHSKTKDLAKVVGEADVVIAAIGKPEAIKGEWIKPGAAVIDVGVNRITVPGQEKAKLVGDVEFAVAKERAGWITPVPGGVGPMTIAMLLENTMLAAEGARGAGGPP